nr:MAG TPA: hypothetical protein [Caudoviricetes sp.]
MTQLLTLVSPGFSLVRVEMGDTSDTTFISR